MKIISLCLVLCAAPLLAQTADTKTPPASPLVAGLDENTRLMQEYMARRAEWLEVRQSALDKVKTAKTDQEKKQNLDKLAADEKPALAKMNDAARAYKAAKATSDAALVSKPRG